MDIWGFYWINVVASKKQLWKPHHQEDLGEEGSAGHHGIHKVVIIFLSNLSHTPFPSPLHLSSYFFLSLSTSFTFHIPLD